VRNELIADAGGRLAAVATDEREVIPCGLVLRSVGYQGVPLPGVPFENGRGTIPNEGGRVLDEDGARVAGVYCTGWIKRGPSGVIGTNKKDAAETAELLLEDARAGLLSGGAPAADVDSLLAAREVEHVTYAGWEAIDNEERTRGEPQGRPRVKLCSWDELLGAARG
jgi:ferredoxin--NADP+ reductase